MQKKSKKGVTAMSYNRKNNETNSRVRSFLSGLVF